MDARECLVIHINNTFGLNSDFFQIFTFVKAFCVDRRNIFIDRKRCNRFVSICRVCRYHRHFVTNAPMRNGFRDRDACCVRIRYADQFQGRILRACGIYFVHAIALCNLCPLFRRFYDIRADHLAGGTIAPNCPYGKVTVCFLRDFFFPGKRIAIVHAGGCACVPSGTFTTSVRPL